MDDICSSLPGKQEMFTEALHRCSTLHISVVKAVSELYDFSPEDSDLLASVQLTERDKQNLRFMHIFWIANFYELNSVETTSVCNKFRLINCVDVVTYMSRINLNPSAMPVLDQAGTRSQPVFNAAGSQVRPGNQILQRKFPGQDHLRPGAPYREMTLALASHGEPTVSVL